MVIAVLHDFVATRRYECSTGSEYSRQVDQRSSHSWFTCRQVSIGCLYLYPLSSYRCVVSGTSLHAGQVRLELELSVQV